MKKEYIGYAIFSICIMVIGYFFSLGLTSLFYNPNNASKEMALSAMSVFAVLYLVGVVAFATCVIVRTIIKYNHKK